MAASKATEEIRDILKKLLDDRFEKDGFEFGPIVVTPCVDDDGTSYLQSYIVFNGDQEKLDPIWTLRLSDSLWPQAEALGYPGIPIQLFVERSEWAEELQEMLAWTPRSY